MKRTSEGAPVKKNTMGKDLFGRDIPSLGVWDSEANGELLIYTSDNVESKEKIAAFDMDGTLITTKSGKVFPTDTGDWKLLDAKIPKKLAELNEDGYKIIICTNQKGLELKHVQKKDFQKKIEAVVKALGVPVQVFVSAGSGRYRKPCIGMWEALNRHNDNVVPNKEKSVFVGDAAGRIKTKIRPKKDHSHADRFFAGNVGLPFFTPERFFFNSKAEEPWTCPSFMPSKLISNKLPLLEPENAKLPADVTEIIVMVGFPGSGKSTFAKNLANDFNYAVVSRDVLGTWQKCVEKAKLYLNTGQSVVIDNTNPDIESRARYIKLAKEMNLSIRCFIMACTMENAFHNIRYRSLTQPKVPKISSMIVRMHNNKYKKPELTEGFDEIVLVNFAPQFENPEDESLYCMYLTE